MACDNFYGKRWTVNNTVNFRSELEVYLRNGSNCAWHERAAAMSRLFLMWAICVKPKLLTSHQWNNEKAWGSDGRRSTSGNKALLERNVIHNV